MRGESGLSACDLRSDLSVGAGLEVEDVTVVLVLEAVEEVERGGAILCDLALVSLGGVLEHVIEVLHDALSEGGLPRGVGLDSDGHRGGRWGVYENLGGFDLWCG